MRGVPQPLSAKGDPVTGLPGPCTGAPYLEEILEYEGAHTVAAMALETRTGTNGIIVPPTGTLRAVREVCDHYGTLLILDEGASSRRRVRLVTRRGRLDRGLGSQPSDDTRELRVAQPIALTCCT